jgi:hypothetical protein
MKETVRSACRVGGLTRAGVSVVVPFNISVQPTTRAFGLASMYSHASRAPAYSLRFFPFDVFLVRK